MAGSLQPETTRVLLVNAGDSVSGTRLRAWGRSHLAPRGIQIRYHETGGPPGSSAALDELLSETDVVVLGMNGSGPSSVPLEPVRQFLRSGRSLIVLGSLVPTTEEARPTDGPGRSGSELLVEVVGARPLAWSRGGAELRVHLNPEAGRHPVLRGIRSPEFAVPAPGHRFGSAPADSRVLLRGGASRNDSAPEPLAWTRRYGRSRIVYGALPPARLTESRTYGELIQNGVLWGAGRPIRPMLEVAATDEVARFMRQFPGRGDLGDSSGYRTPREALHLLDHPEDVAVDLVASEPTIFQPVDVAFDARGRLWVVQYNQFPYPAGLKVRAYDHHLRATFTHRPVPPPGGVEGADRVTVLSDTTGDGRFDTARDVLSGLNIATSVALGRGGIWVLSPPYLLKYPDPDADGRPEGSPVVHLEGFGLQDTHSVANSLTWGPDGWLYGASGSTTIDSVRSAVTPTTVYQGQAIWRYHPETQVFEVFAEGGGNTFHVTFDRKGRLFSGHNGGRARAFHYKQGAYYRKNWGKHGPLTNPYAYGHFDHMPHTGRPERFTHAEIVYDGEVLPERYRGRMISLNSLQNRMPVSRLKPTGSTFETEDVEMMLTTSDGWFRPVDVEVGLDGAVYVADWYDDRLSHVDPRDTWHRASGRIYRLRERATDPSPPVDLRERTSRELTGLLDHPNQAVRRKARLILGDRKDASVHPRLRSLVEETLGQEALEALWALEVSGGLDEELTRTWLAHENPHVRRWTVRLLGDGRSVSDETARSLADRARREPDAEVRSQLAATAGRLGTPHALSLLEELMKQEEDANDPHLPLQIWWSLEAHAEDRAAVLDLFGEEDTWSQPLVRRHLIGRLARRYGSVGGPTNFRTVRSLLDRAPADSLRDLVLTGLDRGLRDGGTPLAELPEPLARALRDHRASGDPGSLARALRRGEPAAIDSAAALLTDVRTTDARRLAIIELLAEVRRPDAIPALLTVADRSGPDTGPLQRAALHTLGFYRNPEIGRALVEAYPNQLRADPETRTTALEILTSRPAWTRALLDYVEKRRIDPTDVPEYLLDKLETYPDSVIGTSLRTYWPNRTRDASGDSSVSDRVETVGRILDRGSGRSERGEAVFDRTCRRCHTLHGEGGSLGPDLTTYDRENRSYLILHTVVPDAGIREGYVNHLVITPDGRRFTGLVTDRSGGSVSIRTPAGQHFTWGRDEITSLRPLRQSIMPGGLLDRLTPDQVRDLFAYLQSAD